MLLTIDVNRAESGRLIHIMPQDAATGTPTMNLEAGFLRSICAEPDEDTHRLVFADWLSMMAALGWAFRPTRTRTAARTTAWIRSHVPSSRQARKS